MTSLTKAEWADAIKLAVADLEHAERNRDEVVRDSVRVGGLSYSQAGAAAGRSKGWVASVVNGERETQ